MTLGDFASIAAYVGAALASLGAIGSAFITTRSRRGESRAHAADLVVDAAGSLTDRLSKLNQELDADNHKLRFALLSVSRQLDMTIPLIEGPPLVLEQLNDANNAAKLAF